MPMACSLNGIFEKVCICVGTVSALLPLRALVRMVDSEYVILDGVHMNGERRFLCAEVFSCAAARLGALQSACEFY